MGGIVGIGDIDAIRIGDLVHRAGGVVVDGGGGTAGAAGVQPAARGVGQVGEDVVAVLRADQAAVLVVGHHGADMAQGVGDLVEVASAVTCTADGAAAGFVGGQVVEIGRASCRERG